MADALRLRGLRAGYGETHVLEGIDLALAAGESRRMPVTFVIDPKLPASVKAIALSYTFFEVPGKS